MITTPKFYRTPDLHLASAMLERKISFQGVESDVSGKRKIFVFLNEAKVEEVVKGFINDTLTVNLRVFLDSWKKCRRLID